MIKPYTNFSACLHGISAEDVRLVPDEANTALFVYLGEGVSLRVDLKRPEVHGRDLAGLLRLAEVAAQAAADLGRHAAEGGTGG